MKNSLTTFYIVRHAESEGNVKGVGNHVVGKGTGLTKKGINQATFAADKLKTIHFDAVFSSDFTRAIQTAEIIVKDKELVIQTTERLRERSLGLYFKNHPEQTRETVESDLQKIFANLDDKAKMAYKLGDEVENAEEAVSRFITFIRETAIAYEGKTILIICHGNLMRTFLAHLGWAKYDELPKSSIQNTGSIILDTDGVDFFIKGVQGVSKNKNGKRGW